MNNNPLGWVVRGTLALIIVIGLNFIPVEPVHATPLGPAVPSLDPATLDTHWTGVFDRRQQPRGWIQGDGGASLALPDGRILFMWADTNIGTVEADGTVDPFWTFIHNSLVTTDASGGNFTSYYSGSAGHESAYIPNVPARPSNQLWPYSGSVSGSNVYLMANEWTPDSSAFDGMAYTGNVWVIKLALPSLSIVSSTQTIAGDSDIEWGSVVYDDLPAYTYVFGNREGLPNNGRETYLYRVPKGQLDGAREYRTAPGSWSPDRADAVPFIDKEVQSVNRVGGEYRGVFIDPLSQTVNQAHAPAIDGPWTVTPAPVYTIPEAMNTKLLEYMPRIHGELSGAGVVMSYSVDAWTFNDILTDATYYQPRFITGPLAAGDHDNNGHINVYDLSYLLSQWNSHDTQADINSSGTVDIYDLSALLSHWTG